MIRRVVTALVLIPVVLGLLWVGKWGFLGLWLVCGLLMAWEYTTSLAWPYSARVVFGGSLIGVWLTGMGLVPWQGMMGLSFLLLAIWLWGMNPLSDFSRVYQGAFGILYLGLGWGSVGWHFGLKHPYRWEAILGFLLPIWASDTAAYMVGRRWGRHKIRPRLSPQKSWEGLMAGLIAAAFVGYWTIGWTGDFVELPPALVGLGVALIGFFGDVWESAWKRQHALKDTGSLLPGHGGLIDRLDAFLWVGPVWWAMARWL